MLHGKRDFVDVLKVTNQLTNFFIVGRLFGWARLNKVSPFKKRKFSMVSSRIGNQRFKS